MKNNEREIAIASLRKLLRRGTLICTILRRRSRSGTSRRGAMRVDGCGLDVGHQAVRDLSAAVLGDSGALRHMWL